MPDLQNKLQAEKRWQAEDLSRFTTNLRVEE
jgi:hypothetical protein